MFVNKLFTYFTYAYLKKKKVLLCEIFNRLFSYKSEDIDQIFKYALVYL